MATSYKPRERTEAMEEQRKHMEELRYRQRRRKILTYFPDTGPLRRELYVKHMQFFAAGAEFRERAAMAANRIGKTEAMGGYELTCHLTGCYPPWWVGKRFSRPVKAWASGTTNLTVRDILQAKLCGPINDIGTGLIPGDMIVDWKKKAANVPDTIETCYIRHDSGGVSVLTFKSYEQGRKAFEGTEQDVILLDEEPPIDIYTECLTRIMPTSPAAEKGIIMLTFTPLEGMTETVMQFMPGGRIPDHFDQRYIVQATWDDAPHLSDRDKKEILASYPPHQRDARSKGIPQLGSGAIYPLPEEDLLVDDFVLPAWFCRAYGMDVGWNCTAAVWGAHDMETDTLYLYRNYKRGHAEPAVHVNGIQLAGSWIPGVIDPASRGRSQRDGEALIDEYIELGLDLSMADNAREAGIFAVWQRMVSGRLKVFRSLQPWLEEFRIYRRDDKGQVVKENDHLMDCTRYLVMSGISIAQQIPVHLTKEFQQAAAVSPSTGADDFGSSMRDWLSQGNRR